MTPVTKAVALIAAEIAMAGTFIYAGTVGYEGTAYALPVPACAEEDGNTDGQPCLWSDPDTGARYFVTSENYR